MLPERVPAEGLLILRDGEPGEPEVPLSPFAYHYQHRAEIEAEAPRPVDLPAARCLNSHNADKPAGGRRQDLENCGFIVRNGRNSHLIRDKLSELRLARAGMVGGAPASCPVP